MPDSSRLCDVARDIWDAGVAAVRSERLMENVLHCDGSVLTVCGRSFPLADLGQIAVIGAGKAGAGMAAAVEDILGPELVAEKLIGWVNVPADCVRPLERIYLHAARPAGVNEPTEEGVAGAREILKIVEGLTPRDLCLVLLSGGGSALLPAPVPEVSLADKQAVTRFLMQSGATIQELNLVRKQLSQVKGGNLAWAIRAGATLALVISDVVHDPLDIIASGPTVPDSSTPAEALAVLQKFGGVPPRVPSPVIDYLTQAAPRMAEPRSIPASVSTQVIGNNQVALNAAANRARELGFTVHSLGSNNQGEANQVGRELAELCVAIREGRGPVAAPACVLSGGEPVVHLTPTDRPRKGGRNQQVALAALTQLWDAGCAGLAVFSGGTDGEDGPTDAAGACTDEQAWEMAHDLELNPDEYLASCDAYHFFEQVNGLIKTGPTHTNVMDLRVALIQ